MPVPPVPRRPLAADARRPPGIPPVPATRKVRATAEGTVPARLVLQPTIALGTRLQRLAAVLAADRSTFAHWQPLPARGARHLRMPAVRVVRTAVEDLVELSRGARDAREAGLVQHPVHGPGSHYWAPAAGGKVCRANPTQFGRAIGEVGIEMIPSYSTKSRGRSQRWFGTVQGRLPRELALGGITGTSDANGLSSRVVLAADEPAVRRSPSGDAAGPEAKTLVTTGRGAGICGPDGTSVPWRTRSSKLSTSAGVPVTNYAHASIRFRRFASRSDRIGSLDRAASTASRYRRADGRAIRAGRCSRHTPWRRPTQWFGG